MAPVKNALAIAGQFGRQIDAIARGQNVGEAQIREIGQHRQAPWPSLILLFMAAACSGQDAGGDKTSSNVSGPQAEDVQTDIPLAEIKDEDQSPNGAIATLREGDFVLSPKTPMCVLRPHIDGVVDYSSAYQVQVTNNAQRINLLTNIHRSLSSRAAESYDLPLLAERNANCDREDAIKFQQYYTFNKLGKPYRLVIVARQGEAYIQVELSQENGLNADMRTNDLDVQAQGGLTFSSIAFDSFRLQAAFGRAFSG